jgi:hypothetical protein
MYELPSALTFPLGNEAMLILIYNEWRQWQSKRAARLGRSLEFGNPI